MLNTHCFATHFETLFLLRISKLLRPSPYTIPRFLGSNRRVFLALYAANDTIQQINNATPTMRYAGTTIPFESAGRIFDEQAPIAHSIPDSSGNLYVSSVLCART